MIGEVLDHYRVLELVGRGAMGVVYKALDVNLDRLVAIKVMSAEARSDPDFVERFRQEARAQGALNHPNVALLFDYFLHEGAPVAVMEFIDGESLEQLIRRRGAIAAHESIPLFKQALSGVAAAHRAGIIHRDLKPANLMATSGGIVKVMDFGIAKRQGVTGATKFTSTSIGSPLYMAPEQILGRTVDCRTDVYALGVTLYELLAGQRPFNSRAKAEYLVLDAHVNEVPEPPTVYRYGIPQPIVDAVMRALAKDPNARFQSVDEFMRALPEVPAPHAGALPRVDTSRTVALEYTPPAHEGTVTAPEAHGTVVFEYAAAAATRRDPGKSMAFDFSAATLLQEPPRQRPPSSAAAPAAPLAATARASSAAPQRRRPAGLQRAAVVVAALLATVLLGALLRHAGRVHAVPPESARDARSARITAAQTSVATQAPIPPESTGPPAPTPAPVPAPEPTARPAEVAVTTPVPAAAATPVVTATPARHDLSGTWRGVYIDASGKPLLRVRSLSISRVRNDGGIEGTLQYEAASGEGECQLHPRHSSWRPSEQRLQLSPEGCSPHYPKELGVPLDFNRVDPQANTLGEGRLEAPTGEVIRVRLKRVSGA
ncbi:MAG: serine/threonine protein kinase [Gammaproteobacteria bacterium]|nr:serine/threonine protein kinase [Gammaproteobacteria bacterium]